VHRNWQKEDCNHDQYFIATSGKRVEFVEILILQR